MTLEPGTGLHPGDWDVVQIAPESWESMRRLWIAAEKREHVARVALARIANRAQRILAGEVETTAIGAANYDLQVCLTILESGGEVKD